MPLSTGTRIGPYEILAPLGAGGMGEVYRAHDPRLERAVAIKVLTSSSEVGPRQLRRFQLEAKAIARLSHPHICTLHDVGDEGGVPFLVMELLDGETLAERLERGALPIRDALDVAVQMADALDTAHRDGVTHADLKPSNIMLTRTGVKLLDFGLATLRGPDPEATVDGSTSWLTTADSSSIRGTLPYMAPERIDGADADVRSDIYSFGVVLYEMIAGRRPFAGDSRVSLIAAIAAGDPPALSTVQPATPRALDRVVRRCLTRDAEHRWQTARDLGAELRWIREGGSGGIDPPSHEPQQPRRRRRFVLGALAVVVVAIAALARASTFSAAFTAAFWGRPATVAADYWAVTYRRGVVSAARFTPDGQSFVYSASWEGRPYDVFLGRPDSPDARSLNLESGRILSISQTGDMAVLFGPQNIERAFGARTLARIPMAGGARRDLLDGVVVADWIPGTNEMAIVRDPGGGRPWTVEFPAGKVVHEARAAWSLRVSPDGQRIAFFEGPLLFDSSPEAMVTTIDREGRKSTLSRYWSGYGLAWAPSGEEVWFTATHGGVDDPTRPPTGENRNGAPWLTAVSLSGVERTIDRVPDWLVLHDIAPDGRLLMARNTIRIGISCQAPGESTERDLSWQISSFASGLSPDGRTLLFFDALGGRTAGGSPTVFRRALDGSPAVALGEGSRATMSPDGTWALTQRENNLVLLPVGAGTPATLPRGPLTRLGFGVWLNDSRRIVFTGGTEDSGPRVYVQEIPSGAPQPITAEGVVLVPTAAASDDDFVLTRADDRALLYPTDGGEPRPLSGLSARDIPVQWSNDGRSLYVVESAGTPSPSMNVFRLDVASGQRALWRTLMPSDPVGVAALPVRFVMTRDARAYCYSFMRRLGDLFVVRGLE